MKSSRLIVPSNTLAYPSRLGARRVRRPDWSRVTNEQLAADYLRRRTQHPLLLYQAGLAPRTQAFRTTIRGTCAVFGGTQSAKTVGVGVPWAASIAEGLHPRLACPETCPQYGVGSCGLHCCPSARRGSADIPGCSAGTAVACSKHPPLWWPEPRVILVGVMSLSKWYEALVPAFERWLSRHPDGTPQWRVLKAENAIEHEAGRYRLQAVMYDDPTRNESTSPVAILDDEIPPAKFYEYQVMRAAVRNTQIKICGTTFDLRHRPDRAAWLIPKIVQKAPIPGAHVQVFRLRTLDNIYLEPASLERYAALRESMLADGDEQEVAIRFDGVPSLRQDSCFFSHRTMQRQGANVRPSRRWWVALDTVLPSAEGMPYFRGPTTYPQACVLPGEARQMLEARRAGGVRGGVACYDCIAKCPAYVHPPPASDTVISLPPRLVEKRPQRGECYPVDLWVPYQQGHRYAAGADNAKGTPGGDYNVCDIFDAHTGMQVAQYHGQVAPYVYAAIIAALWAHYRPFIVPELNGFGLEIVTLLKGAYGVPATDIYHRLDSNITLPTGDKLPEPGFWTTRGTKQDPGGTIASSYGTLPSPLGLYEQMLSNGGMSLSSQRSLMQLGSFVWLNGSLAGLPGSKDDCVISGALAALGLWCVRSSLSMTRGMSLALPAPMEAVGPILPPPPPPLRPGDKAPPIQPARHPKAMRRW